MQLTEDKIIEIFYLANKFCQEFDKTISKRKIGNEPKKKPQMRQNEVIKIMVLFHFGSFKNMKHLYLNYINLNNLVFARLFLLATTISRSFSCLSFVYCALFLQIYLFLIFIENYRR